MSNECMILANKEGGKHEFKLLVSDDLEGYCGEILGMPRFKGQAVHFDSIYRQLYRMPHQ